VPQRAHKLANLLGKSTVQKAELSAAVGVGVAIGVEDALQQSEPLLEGGAQVSRRYLLAPSSEEAGVPQLSSQHPIAPAVALRDTDRRMGAVA